MIVRWSEPSGVSVLSLLKVRDHGDQGSFDYQQPDLDGILKSSMMIRLGIIIRRSMGVSGPFGLQEKVCSVKKFDRSPGGGSDGRVLYGLVDQNYNLEFPPIFLQLNCWEVATTAVEIINDDDKLWSHIAGGFITHLCR